MPLNSPKPAKPLGFTASMCRIACVCLTLACVDGAYANEMESAVTQRLGAPYSAIPNLALDQSRLVFYRPQGDGAGVITVHLDGRYHTSLLDGAFSSVCLERTSVNLQAQPGRTWALADPSRQVSQNVILAGGQTLFVRLTEAWAQRPRMDVVPAQSAQAQVEGTRQQTHSLSRVVGAKSCMAAVVPSLSFAPEVITLDASQVNNRAAITQVIQDLEKQYKGFQRVAVHIVGYADGLSTENRNVVFSKGLAEEVHRQWLSQSTRFEPVTFEGRGSQDRMNTANRLGQRVEIGVVVLDK